MDNSNKLKSIFEANSNPVDAKDMAAYMRDMFNFYGIKAPIRKSLYKEIIKEAKKSKVIDWELLDKSFANEHREFHYFVVDYLAAMQKFVEFDDIPKIYNYIKTNQWQDTVDGFDKIIGDIYFKDERVRDLMLEWSTNEDFWVRRIAIDHQLSRKDKTDADLLGQIIENNFGSNEFFINKAIGWALRDYSKVNPTWVREFIDKNRDRMANLSIREGSKYI